MARKTTVLNPMQRNVSAFTPGAPSAFPLARPAGPPSQTVPDPPDPVVINPNEQPTPRIPSKPFDVRTDPDYQGGQQPTTPTTPTQPTDPTTPTTPVVDAEPGLPDPTPQPFPEATRGRAYYGVISDGPNRGTLGYFVFNPSTRAYDSRPVTPAQWQKIQGNRSYWDKVREQITQAMGGPNWTVDVADDMQGGGAVGVRYQQRGQRIVNGQNVNPDKPTPAPFTPAALPNTGTASYATPTLDPRAQAQIDAARANPNRGRPNVRTSPNSMFPAAEPDNKGIAPGTTRFAFGKNYVWTLSNGQYKWIESSAASPTPTPSPFTAGASV